MRERNNKLAIEDGGTEFNSQDCLMQDLFDKYPNNSSPLNHWRVTFNDSSQFTESCRGGKDSESLYVNHPAVKSIKQIRTSNCGVVEPTPKKPQSETQGRKSKWIFSRPR